MKNSYSKEDLAHLDNIVIHRNLHRNKIMPQGERLEDAVKKETVSFKYSQEDLDCLDEIILYKDI